MDEDDLALVQFLDEHGEGLTSWEVDFVESCMRRVNALCPLSEAQRAKIVQITSNRVPGE